MTERLSISQQHSRFWFPACVPVSISALQGQGQGYLQKPLVSRGPDPLYLSTTAWARLTQSQASHVSACMRKEAFSALSLHGHPPTHTHTKVLGGAGPSPKYPEIPSVVLGQPEPSSQGCVSPPPRVPFPSNPLLAQSNASSASISTASCERVMAFSGPAEDRPLKGFHGPS